MEGLNVLIAAAGGFVVAAVAVWLVLRTQIAAADRRARAEAEGQLELLRQQLAARDGELERLRAEHRRELELRAKAEAVGGRAVQLERKLAEQTAQCAALQQENATLRERISRLDAQLEQERRQGEEKLRLLDEAREQLTLQFKQLANDILEDKSRRFTDQNRSQLEGLLNPLREQIKEFEKKVQDSYDKESKDRMSLFGEIMRLKELNQKISQDAVNLTKALKGESKTQGIWGELVLEQVLERSGLCRGREYVVQQSFVDEHGRRQQPDVIVHLPEGRHVIIDSKVSLTAYERFCASEDEAERQLYLREHAASLRNHCKGLSAKAYQRLGLRTLDYVLMFVPIESAYVDAARYDPDLFGDALEKNIVIVTPSTLLATLRTIHNIWRFEYQNRHAAEIAEKAGRLYDKFVGFVADLEEVGRKLAATQKSYDDARKKLVSGRGNLVKSAEDIKALGAKASKSLPADLVETAAEQALPRELAGAEE